MRIIKKKKNHLHIIIVVHVVRIYISITLIWINLVIVSIFLEGFFMVFFYRKKDNFKNTRNFGTLRILFIATLVRWECFVKEIIHILVNFRSFDYFFVKFNLVNKKMVLFILKKYFYI